MLGLLVLVVDDDDDQRALLESWLNEQGAKVISASCVAEGLEALIDRRPDVLISDLQMPGEDGFAFMQRVRRAADDRARQVPSIAISSLSGAEPQRLARQAGFWRFLTKPLDRSVVCRQVAAFGHAYRRFCARLRAATGPQIA